MVVLLVVISDLASFDFSPSWGEPFKNNNTIILLWDESCFKAPLLKITVFCPCAKKLQSADDND